MVSATATSITLVIPLVKPGWFTRNEQIQALMLKIMPWACLGLSMHPIVVGLEGCLLAKKDMQWLVINYTITGVLSVVATVVLLFTAPQYTIATVWQYLAVYQATRLCAFFRRALLRKSDRPSRAAVGAGSGSKDESGDSGGGSGASKV